MNNQLKQFERTSNIGVYALGLDKAKWDMRLERFAELVIIESANWVNDNVGMMDEKARADLLRHFGVEE